MIGVGIGNDSEEADIEINERDIEINERQATNHQPVQRQVAVTGDNDVPKKVATLDSKENETPQQQREATLSKCPRDLWTLWEETKLPKKLTKLRGGE